MRAVSSCLVGLVALLGLGAPGSASAADGLITAFTIENVSSLLTEAGGTELANKKDSAGNPIVIAQFVDGPVFATLVDCEGAPTCPGVQFAAYFENKSGLFTTNFANDYNRTWLLATAIIETDGSLTLADFVRATGGISRENLADNFAHFMAAPIALAEEIKKRSVTSYAPGGTRLSASALPARMAPRTGYLVRLSEPPANRK
jgi:hypothetical protein